MQNKYGTALNCIDGRTQMPIINWFKENYDVDYLDLITEPGMDKILYQGQSCEIEKLRVKVMISIKIHNSNVIAVVGHYDCAGNPVSECKHFSDIVKSTEVVKSWALPVEVVGLWVDKFLCVNVVTK